MLGSNPMTITEQDAQRLFKVASLYSEVDAEATSSLLDELERAVVVSRSEVESSLVTMHSRITCRDDDGNLRDVELVYPREADVTAGRISVLAPLGRALLGARLGDRVTVLGRGRVGTWEIVAIHYQPEAAGDHHL